MQYDKGSGKFVPKDQLFALKNGSMLSKMEAEIQMFKQLSQGVRSPNPKDHLNLITEESRKKREEDFIKPGELIFFKSPFKVQAKRAQQKRDLDNIKDIEMIGPDGNNLHEPPKKLLLQPMQLYHLQHNLDDDIEILDHSDPYKISIDIFKRAPQKNSLVESSGDDSEDEDLFKSINKKKQEERKR